MKRIKRIGVASFGKTVAFIYFFIGLIIGIFFAADSLGGLSFSGGDGGFLEAIGVWAIIIFPVCYGILGFIGGILIAFLYNTASKRTGGVEIEFHD
ncbi:MAG TPA: hypothetical protein VJH55_00950 [Candidatus Paceibacterota bacterium]